jgi:hypothetical protein
MCLVKKGVPLCWDEVTQFSFEALKRALMSSPLLSPLDYSKDLLLYLDTTEYTIGMVLVQEDDVLEDHVMYYVSRGLVGKKLNYTRVEKLALEIVHVVQRFCHYILVRKTTILAALNYFQFVLTRWVIGGKISRWIGILVVLVFSHG